MLETIITFGCGGYWAGVWGGRGGLRRAWIGAANAMLWLAFRARPLPQASLPHTRRRFPVSIVFHRSVMFR